VAGLMFEKILPDLYRIEIPLPKSPLKSLNSYLIKGEERFLIIDTGMNRQECLNEMLAALTYFDVDLNKTDFFITHLHVDHLGLVEKLITESSKVYFNSVEASMIANGSKHEKGWTRTDAVYLLHGFPQEELTTSIAHHPRTNFGLTRHIDFYTMEEGDGLSIGNYTLKCVATPGHSPGHMCLYEPDKKILFAGDHILFDITPNITFWFNMENSLQTYLTSLEKIYQFDVSLVLPGHRSIMNDHRKRIRELEEHHNNRLHEAMAALSDGPKTAYQVTPCISWDFKYKSWELFPSQQRWFAFGETLAHLKYLEQAGKIHSHVRDNQTFYSVE
jgi:glyoxylase-like metal-dependent hydrolase (beta-lactamase superfamily II)